jgi:DNA gyrase inhibitor GyrI
MEGQFTRASAFQALEARPVKIMYMQRRGTMEATVKGAAEELDAWCSRSDMTPT